MWFEVAAADLRTVRFAVQGLAASSVRARRSLLGPSGGMSVDVRTAGQAKLRHSQGSLVEALSMLNLYRDLAVSGATDSQRWEGWVDCGEVGALDLLSAAQVQRWELVVAEV
jgi:hypothetical protein